MKYNYLILSVIFLCLTTLLCQSQDLRSTYPIQVTAFMNPPYSLKIEDYYNSTRPKLSVTLLNRDLMEPVVDVRLHFSIKAGNGIRLETKDYLPYPVIRLHSGTPYLLSQTDLYSYLKSENLDIQGIFSNGQFPEGMIEICIYVLEASTNKILSQTSCARAWVTLNRPPILNLPQNNIKLPFQEPQNILFQWTPRHQGLSNVEYQFVLKEIWDETVAYEVTFPYSQEVYSTTIKSTSLPYSAMMPSLMENKRYAWQVRAVAKDGFEELSLFENNGYSEIHGFSIAQSCHAPHNIKHHQDKDHLVIEWEPDGYSQISVVAYRAKNSGSDWTVIRGNENYTRIFDLAFDIEYEYKVGTVCSDGNISYSDTYTVVLEDWRKQFKISCGMIPAFDKSNFDPLPTLNIGDVFTAGDFPITVMEAKGSNGTFSGKGWTAIPLFGFVKIAVQFTGIKINTSLQLADGSIETSYDKDEKLIADMDRLWHGGNDTGHTKTGAVQNKVKANFSIPDGATGEYDNSSGEIVIKDKDGNIVGNVKIPNEDKEIFTSGKPYSYTIVDQDGKIFVLTKDENGKTGIENIGKTGKPLPEGSFNETSIARNKAVVQFIESENAKYSFDIWKDYYKTVSLIVNKNTYEFIDSEPVACKLIPSGESDYVGFKVNKTDKNLIEDSIIFKTKTGYTVIPKDGQLHIAGGNDNDAQDLFALYPNGKGGYYTLGKLKILSYPKKTGNVVLVPVNGNTIDSQSVEEYLNSVYGKVGIQWNVSTDPTFTYPYTDLHSEGSDLFSQYTDEMKDMNSAYKSSQGSLDKNSVYLFILKDGSIKGKAVEGDMPRGKQFGYVFTESGGDINRTIAHELGHGLFKLRHIFDGEYGGTAKSMEGKTDNLMDYGSGTLFAKWQWDEIHDPAIFVNPFESDEDGMRIGEAERGQITRFIYAIRDVALNKVSFLQSKSLTSNDCKKLNSKIDFSVMADHIFYNQNLSDFFEKVEVKLLFNAKKRQEKAGTSPFFISEITTPANRYIYIEDLDAIIIFLFNDINEASIFNEFIGAKNADPTPPISNTRKTFFIHGTESDNERWLEHPLAIKTLLCIAGTDKYDSNFNWTENHLTNNVQDRQKAAQKLANYVLSQSSGFNEIVLIGHSHGGNVSLQVVNQLVSKGKSVYLISTSTPAYNNLFIESYDKNYLQNCDVEEITEYATNPTSGVSIRKKYRFKNPEYPGYTLLRKHLHLWNSTDGVAGGLAGNDFYSPNGITENIEIKTENEYSDFTGSFNIMKWEMTNAHGSDANRPQLIYKMLINKQIQPIK